MRIIGTSGEAPCVSHREFVFERLNICMSSRLFTSVRSIGGWVLYEKTATKATEVTVASLK